MSKNILLTDSDLDGVGCACVFSYVHNKLNEEVEIHFCSHSGKNEVNKILNEVLLNIPLHQLENNYVNLYITDLSVNGHFANVLTSMNNRYANFKIVLLDHHESETWLNRYKWAKISTIEDGIEQCGTTLLASYFESFKSIDLSPIKFFIESVRLRDTGLYFTDRENPKYDADCMKLSYYFNGLLIMTSQKEFVKRFNEYVEHHKSESPIFFGYFIDGDEADYLQMRREKYLKYYKAKEDSIYIRDFHLSNGIDVKVAVLFASHDISELGNDICRNFKSVDFCIMINTDYDTVEMRCIKDGINLENIAKSFGGGGHKKAAGFPLNDTIKGKMFDVLFK